MKHTCHAYGCETEVTQEMLMCKAHWGMVPSKLKQAIYSLRGKPEARKEWRHTAQQAINAVGMKENNMPPPLRREGMRYVCDMPEGYHSFAIVGETVIAAGANLPTIFFNPKTKQWEEPPLPQEPVKTFVQEPVVYAG